MYLAYVDESDTKAKPQKWQVMSAVLIEDKKFKFTEIAVYGVVEEIIPADKVHLFEEFHACELYGGFGVFEGISQTVRFDAIHRLLSLIQGFGLPVVYGAVDLDRLQGEVCASADPLDVCFRMCLSGISKWSDDHIHARVDTELEPHGGFTEANRDKVHSAFFHSMIEELVMLIVDDCDKKIKEMLHRTFRAIRPRCRPDVALQNLHDDMYFGDSRYSIGIQLADLCSYFIARHLVGDEEIEGFYGMIEPNIRHFDIFPPRLIVPELERIQSGEPHEDTTQQPGVLALHGGDASDRQGIEGGNAETD